MHLSAPCFGGQKGKPSELAKHGSIAVAEPCFAVSGDMLRTIFRNIRLKLNEAANV